MTSHLKSTVAVTIEVGKGYSIITLPAGQPQYNLPLYVNLVVPAGATQSIAHLGEYFVASPVA